MNVSRAAIVALLAVTLLAPAGCKGGSSGGGPPAPTSGPGRATTLYAGAAIVPGYLVSLPPTAAGSVTPLSSIQSPNTPNFADNFLMAYDTSGKLWVTSCQGSTTTAGPVLAFNAGANGTSIPPMIDISGSATGLGGCQIGIAIDGSGNVYVSDQPTGGSRYPNGQVAVFAAGATGNVAPIRRIDGPSPNFHSPGGVALDASGNIYVADSGLGIAGFLGDVQVFASNSNGNVAANRVISGSNTGLNAPFGLALDQVGNLYATNPGNNSITVYAAGVNGNVSPMRRIVGPNTLLEQPTGIAVDAAGYLYVGNENQAANSPILVYAPNANGNVAPIAAITVNAARFAEPSGIAVR